MSTVLWADRKKHESGLTLYSGPEILQYDYLKKKEREKKL